ncbi:DUF2929 family protein, partial [Staphylococcus epidermidis]
MRYLMTFIWAVLLLQMVNFVLNSLNLSLIHISEPTRLD